MGRITDWILGRDQAVELERAEVAEVDGLFDSIIPAWYFENLGMSSFGGLGGLAASSGNARMAERVWVANRCQQMNAQQIATMPLQFHGPDGSEPAWVASPDPNWFPNGIGDAIHAIVTQMYGWGFVLLYVTDRYSTGYPRTWTVLDSSQADVKMRGGQRVYTYGDAELDPSRVIQIDRNPGVALHGTSALRAYGTQLFGLLAAGDQSLNVNQGGIPAVYLKAKRPINEEQSAKIQAKWIERTTQRGGAPPVLPPDIDAENLSINPADLALLETQEFGARAIATAYGVPSVLLNMALQGGLTYQNPGALGEMWWRFELRPTATRIADAFSAQMLPRGQFVSFRADDTFASLTPQSPEDDEQAALEQPTPTPIPQPQAPGLAAVK